MFDVQKEEGNHTRINNPGINELFIYIFLLHLIKDKGVLLVKIYSTMSTVLRYIIMGYTFYFKVGTTFNP